jgi:hypothetical protein
MDLIPNAKPARIANGDSIHACLHHAFQTLLVDA